MIGFKVENIESVEAFKPHGEKADVRVKVRTKAGEFTEGISIKLVSNPKGFNQIDKRWTDTYVEMWNIPKDVEQVLKLFVGETLSGQENLKDKSDFFNLLFPHHPMRVDF